jgi:hypothetical protein
VVLVAVKTQCLCGCMSLGALRTASSWLGPESISPLILIKDGCAWLRTTCDPHRRIAQAANIRIRTAKALLSSLLYLQYIALAGHHLIQHRIDEEPNEEPGDETGNDDDGKWPLGIRSDAGGKSRRQ